MESTSRIHSLDSLRGISALIVVVFHCLISLPAFYTAYFSRQYGNAFIRAFTETPLHTLWAGPEVVLLFFILSGYVLSLPYLKHDKISYKGYIIKRFFRIYIPYIVIMLIYLLIFVLLSDFRNIPALSDAFNARWDHPVTLKALFSYVFMLGYEMTNINGVTWSLVYEMRISIIFPLIIYMVKRLSLVKSLVCGLGASLILYVLIKNFSGRFQGELAPVFISSVGDTFYYCTFFVFGAVLAKYTGNIRAFLQPRKPLLKLLLIFLAILLINFQWTFEDLYKYVTGYSSIIRGSLAREWIIALGVLILFGTVLSSPKMEWVLSRKPLVWLGKISYSLYLVHVVVIMLSVRYLSPPLPLEVTVLLPIVLVLPVASLSYRYIELPSMNLGKRLAGKFRP
jgi:peptidoglycan/LPS O-acetylase OafA/YrhL